MVSILSQYCINVSDIDKAIEFWEGIVGIPVHSRTDIPNAKEAVLQAHAGWVAHAARAAPRPRRPDRHG